MEFIWIWGGWYIFLLNVVQSQPTNPIRAYQFPGQPFVHHPPHKALTPLSPQDSQCYFWWENAQCVCVHVWQRQIGSGGGGLYMYTSIGVYMSLCTCMLEQSISKALVLLQGTLISSSHLATVFSHQRESHNSRSFHRETCVCIWVKWEVFWSMSMPLVLSSCYVPVGFPRMIVTDNIVVNPDPLPHAKMENNMLLSSSLLRKKHTLNLRQRSHWRMHNQNLDSNGTALSL